MESSSRRLLLQRSRSARGPPQGPPHPHHARQPLTARSRRSPSNFLFAAADDFDDMEEDAASSLMDIDESPLNGAGFLDEDDMDGDIFIGPSRGGGRGCPAFNDLRGPLPYTDFFNSFDGADFDDADLE